MNWSVKEIYVCKLIFLQFTERKVVTKHNGQDYKHTLYSRNLLGAIRQLLRDPSLSNNFVFDAERHYIARPSGGIMRIYQEYHHGDDFWDIQVCISLIFWI
jgi:hypothetical protein